MQLAFIYTCLANEPGSVAKKTMKLVISPRDEAAASHKIVFDRRVTLP